MPILINADKFLNPDDRLQPLFSGNNNIIEIAVEELEKGRPNYLLKCNETVKNTLESQWVSL